MFSLLEACVRTELSLCAVAARPRIAPKHPTAVLAEVHLAKLQSPLLQSLLQHHATSDPAHQNHGEKLQQTVTRALEEGLIDEGDKEAIVAAIKEAEGARARGMPEALVDAGENAIIKTVIDGKIKVASAAAAGYGQKTSTVF